MQSYIVSGVRSTTVRSNSKALFYQPAALLELVVYHNELKHLNRIKEVRWACLYQHLFSHVIKNGIALFMVELLSKCLKQPEANEDLFAFTEDALQHLDRCQQEVITCFPLFFALHLTHFLGLSPHNTAVATTITSADFIFDLKEGIFTTAMPQHPLYLQHQAAQAVAALLQVQHPDELPEIKVDALTRRKILDAFEIYYALHLPEFGKLKTLPVLREIMR